MKRKAILIESSNVKGQSDLPGARVDVSNWQSFLKSRLGGLWMDSEIVILRKPYSGDLERELKTEEDCYVFVAFSGHGSEGSIVLNDHWNNYPIEKLKPHTRKGTTIIDSCRGFDEATATRVSKTSAVINEAYASMGRSVFANAQTGKITTFSSVRDTTTETLTTHRKVWFTSLQNSSTGIVEMYACDKGQGAGENPNAGGYYTSLLLQSADVWEQGSSTSKIHTTREAHNHAVAQMPPPQTPVYTPLNLAFPFAVKA